MPPRARVPQRRYSDRKEVRDDVRPEVLELKRFVETNGHFSLVRSLDLFILTVFVCAGVARLARFNITAAAIPHDASGKARYFEGLPIPSSLLLVCGMALCLALGTFDTRAGEWSGAPRSFTGALGAYFNVTPSGVPFGTSSLDVSEQIHKVFTALGAESVFGHRIVYGLASYLGTFTVHRISFLWLGWSMALVSKTLRIPKP